VTNLTSNGMIFHRSGNIPRFQHAFPQLRQSLSATNQQVVVETGRTGARCCAIAMSTPKSTKSF
jgi:hypothetical protein